MFDEAREMERDLRIGRLIIAVGRRDRARLTELVDLDDPGRDCPAGGLPDEASGKTTGDDQRAEEGEPPVLGLDPRKCGTIGSVLRGSRPRTGGSPSSAR